MSARLPREYRIRSEQMAGVYVAVGIGTPGVLLTVLNMEDTPVWVKSLVVALVLAFFGWLVVAAKRCSTSADLKGIRVRRFTGTRRLAWEDVQDIRAAPNPSAHTAKNQPTVVSYAYDDAGRRVQLMYVDDNHVDVAREVDALRAAWEELRGPDWAQDPEAVRRIARHDVRDRRVRQTYLWTVMIIVVGFVVAMVSLFAG
ncbi:PH domain-containing protein [Streptomyces sp. NPDC059999]|uniref:PH domain-containing protein n=1 Tax=unclassified Streptomyces TaxID=2593676 RepID=UPI002E36EE95|nr:PH domain-containing protein [Streptomyces sp. NBC_01426]